MQTPTFLTQNQEITHLSGFKTKAFCKYYFEINDESDIDKIGEILDFSQAKNLETLFVGSGTNMLFAFDVFDGIVIKNNLKGFYYDQKSHILEVYSSEETTKIALKLEQDFGQDIWHRFIGLPGSIGGAVFGNAGCFGLEVEGNFLKAEVLNLETKQKEILSKDEIEFEYRNSLFKKTRKYFIIKLFFDLSLVVEKYSSDVDNIKFREELQPKGNSCGSFFKNPSKEHPAGKLLDEVGLRGYDYKNAYLSEKHSNFLMTKQDNGDYRDLLHLIDLAQKKVGEQFGIEISPEVQIIRNKNTH